MECQEAYAQRSAHALLWVKKGPGTEAAGPAQKRQATVFADCAYWLTGEAGSNRYAITWRIWVSVRMPP
jgi:hypothetical protein